VSSSSSSSFCWPRQRRCAFALTFDVDGETTAYALDREQAAARLSLISEYTYEARVAVPRILDLLELYEVRASFFSPGRVVELHPETARSIVGRGHELGHHGYMHERPVGLSDAQEERVLLEGIAVLEAATGQRPIGYRSPAWDLKPSSPALLVRHGFAFDSSLMGHDLPYWIETAAGRLLELPVHWRQEAWPLLGFASPPRPGGGGMAAPSAAFEILAEQFEGLYERGALCVLTLHPSVIGRPAGLRLLERLLRHIRGFPRVWWATLGELCAYCSEPDVAAALQVESTAVPAAHWLT
jgi:peptidoglycan/xylan/chitin deacetylase (PgdA/CDA1 family)